MVLIFFFFNDTATTEIYTLSLHDALPIWTRPPCRTGRTVPGPCRSPAGQRKAQDRKSTRLNSSHSQISYAVFCLKKKKKNPPTSKPTGCLHQFCTSRAPRSFLHRGVSPIS